MFTEALREAAAQAVLCWLATVDADGQPSVSPKELFALRGAAEVVIADVASAGSVRSIRANRRVCVSFIDVFDQLGYKLYGQADVLAPDATGFAEVGADVLAMAGEAYPVRHLIHVTVDRVGRIRAPSYRLFPDLDDAERRRGVFRRYGVVPRDDGR